MRALTAGVCLAVLVCGADVLASAKKKATPSSTYFEDVTTAVGLPANLNANAISLVDYNSDGAPDLFLMNRFSNPSAFRAYVNSGTGSFTALTVQGLTMTQRSLIRFARGLLRPGQLGAAVSHENYDSVPQMPFQFYTVALQGSVLTFTEETGIAPVINNAMGDFQFLDHNRDGVLDVVIGAFYANRNYQQVYALSDFRAETIHLLTGQRAGGGTTYVDDAGPLGLLTDVNTPVTSQAAAVPIQGLSVCDINGDGRPDILASAYGRRWNKLYLWESGVYVNRAFDLGFAGDPNGLTDYRGNGNSYVSACTDADNNGSIDVFQGELAHSWAGPSSDVSAFLWNQYPQPFLRATNTARLSSFSNRGDLGANWGDYDLNGLQDLLISNSDYPPETVLAFLTQSAPRTFTNQASTLVGSWESPKGAVFVDFDGDGDLDLIVGQSPARTASPPVMRVYRNPWIQRNPSARWIAVKLVNLDPSIPEYPVGTVVRLIENLGGGGQKEIARRTVASGYGTDYQPWDVLHFGVGSASGVTDVNALDLEVIWTNGAVTRVAARLNQVNTVTKDAFAKRPGKPGRALASPPLQRKKR